MGSGRGTECAAEDWLLPDERAQRLGAKCRFEQGTVQHQVLEGTAAAGYVAGSGLAIDVDCRVDAGRLTRPVRFGLAASIEVATSVAVDLQAEVRSQVQAAIRAQARARVQTP